MNQSLVVPSKGLQKKRTLESTFIIQVIGTAVKVAVVLASAASVGWAVLKLIRILNGDEETSDWFVPFKMTLVDITDFPNVLLMLYM